MFTNFPFFPQQASAQAAQVDGIYFFMVAVTAFFSLLIASLLVLFAIKYHRRHEDEVGVEIHGALALELLWTIIPFAITMVMFVWGAKVFFDSYRHYGNQGLQRQLWGAAVDVSAEGKYAADPSHPAFYLTGQEFGTGNHRAFTALDPCRKDGDACVTGIDCCGGFCTNGKCGVPPPPPPDKPRCAQTDESCANGTACCVETDHCIAGHCGTIIR